LNPFLEETLEGSWTGRREREAVSFFSFGALVDEITTDGIIRNSRQIGLEVPVPCLKSQLMKKIMKIMSCRYRSHCKALVIPDYSIITPI